MKGLLVAVVVGLVAVAGAIGYLAGYQAGQTVPAAPPAATGDRESLLAELTAARADLASKTEELDASLRNARGREASTVVGPSGEPVGNAAAPVGEPYTAGNVRYYPTLTGVQQTPVSNLTAEQVQQLDEQWRRSRAEARHQLPSSYMVRYIDTSANKARPTPEQMQAVSQINDGTAARIEREMGPLMDRIESLQVEIGELQRRRHGLQEQLDQEYRDSLRRVLDSEQMAFIERSGNAGK